jgi:DNA-binding MarR family transcriptional regulator
MATTPPAFAQSLAFSLSQVGARSAQLFAEHLHEIGVSARAFGVLANLDVAGSRTQQELADALGIHRNNMVALIDDLEASGWVKRHRSKTDRRAFEIRLTESGAKVVAQVNAAVPLLDKEISQELSKDERKVLSSLLRRVADTLQLTPGVHPHLATRTR